MDSYPQDLLVGVFPLVFAANAILDDSLQSSNERSLFDRFLDVVAASLVDMEGGDGVDEGKSRTVALFRPDEDESSDEDEFDFGFGAGMSSSGGSNRRRSSNSLSAGFYAGFGRRGGHHGTGSSSATPAGRMMDTTAGTADPDQHDHRASYAKALTHGQGFFQRARIESVSTKHGFPPSKDPDGTDNLAFALSQYWEDHRSSRGSGVGSAQKRSGLSSERLQRIAQRHPVGGILPSGWLEKHVHALPSVILVVCTVCSSQQEQRLQDERLMETIEHFKIGLVSKRNCTIHVVGLMDDRVSMAQGDTWSRAISNRMMEDELTKGGLRQPPSMDSPFRVTLLRASSDLQSSDTGQPSSLAFRRLHQSVRDASMVYYLMQARRTKEKLTLLTSAGSADDRGSRGLGTVGAGARRGPGGVGPQSPSHVSGPIPQLLPLVIRYCFKIAIFYEFQWKFEKSLRFMVEAYRHTVRYYEFLVGQKSIQDNSTTSSPIPGLDAASSPSKHTVADTGDSFEVALASSSDVTSAFADAEQIGKYWDKSTVSGGVDTSASLDDMILQCRTVAEWLNLKLLQAGFASHTEGGLLAAANQWRQHCRVFCTRRHSIVLGVDDWFDWSYIARQRLVMSQLVERHPPKALGDLGNEYDEVLLRCSPWRTYESAVEATLRLAVEVDKAKSQSIQGNQSSKDSMKARYVGSLDSEGLAPQLRDACGVDHRGTYRR